MEEGKFKQGQFVIIKITGRVGMILEQISDIGTEGSMPGYWIRTEDLGLAKLAEFEIMERHNGKEN